jgi:dihydroxyacetone kinase
MAKKDSVKKAIESIYSGDARGLRKHINEVLVQKVRKALDKKEKELAKNLIESIDLRNEATQSATTKVKVTQEVECERPERGKNLDFKYSYET